MSRLDSHFAAIAIAGLAGRLGDKRASAEIGKRAGPLAANAMPDLGHLTRGA